MRGFTSIIADLHNQARTAIRKMTPADRGKLAKRGPHQETHFYKWLRGDDRQLSTERLDEILWAAKLEFKLYDGKGQFIHCGRFDRSWHRIDWDAVDWSMGTTEIADKHGISRSHVAKERSKRGIKPSGTKGGRPSLRPKAPT